MDFDLLFKGECTQKVLLFLSRLQKINEITMADTNFVHVFEDETKLKMPLRFSRLYLQHIAESNSKIYQKKTYERNIGSTLATFPLSANFITGFLGSNFMIPGHIVDVHIRH